MARLIPVLLVLLLLGDGATSRSNDVSWMETMKKVHAKFTGTRGTFAQFGDSISYSMAFWSSLRAGGNNMSPEAEAAWKLVVAHQQDECWSGWKGPEFGNDSGMTIRWAHENIDEWLKKLNPEVAVVMFGTNDLRSVPISEYEKKSREVIEKCLNNGTVVILTTIPPRHRMIEKARAYAEVTRKIAREWKLPLCDFFDECLARRPDDWDGAAARFNEYEGYEVPTLISRDGVHPSAPSAFGGDYSEEGLRSHGYGLRNYLTLMRYAEVIRELGLDRK